MKIIALILCCAILLSGCSGVVSQEEAKEQTGMIMTDMAGREVNVPQSIEKVFCAEPVCAIYLYNLAPEKLAGWNYQPTEEEKALLLDGYGDLQTFGMGTSINYEAVIASGADFGLISFDTVNDALIEKIENLEKTLNISFFAIDSSLVKAEEAYTLLGDVLGAEEQGEKLATYTKNIFDSIVEVPAEQQKTVYYGNGVGAL